MSFKIFGAIVILMCCQSSFNSSMAFPVNDADNGNEYPEFCNDKKRLCGMKLVHVVKDVCGPKFSNCTVYVFFPYPPHTQNIMSLIPRSTVRSCCDSGCTPRYLKQFVCTVDSAEITQSPAIEEEEKNKEIFWNEGEIKKMVRYFEWNYYYKHFPLIWFLDYLVNEDPEPYFLWKMFK